MVFLPAIRAAHPQVESSSDGVASGSTPPIDNGSGPAPTNAAGGPGPTSISSARFSATMQPPTGPIRKQNIACDACRSRKIRCQRMTIEQICEQCQGRGSECTSNYVLQLAESKSQKRGSGKRRRKSENAEERDVRVQVDRTVSAETIEVDRPAMERAASSSSARASPQPLGDAPSRRSSSVQSQGQPQSRDQSRPSSTPRSTQTCKSASERQHDLLRYMFAPEAITHSHFDYSDVSNMRQCDCGEFDIWEEMGGQVWSEVASTAHLSLADDHLSELADELLDSFFSITHIRYPLLDPDRFRAQFTEPDTHPDGPIYHPLLAVALAWGARFSENPVLLADREEISARDPEARARGSTRSRMVQLLVVRAREISEVWKVFRYAKMENVQVGILLEPLLAQAPFLKDKYEPSCIQYASRHLLALGLNSTSGLMAVHDNKKKTEAIVTWWMLSLSDGFRSAFNRVQPALYDGHSGSDSDSHHLEILWDQGFQSAISSGLHEGSGAASKVNPRTEQLPTGPHNQAWFTASIAGSSMCRRLCHQLYTPKVKEQGIPLSVLIGFANSNSKWRDQHLSKLGVPSKWPEHWDFLAAITACSTDVYYHCLWLVVMRAVDDFGILEIKERNRGNGGEVNVEVQSVLERYRTESDHGAMRIAALAAVLTENGYLRLDPFVIYHPIYEAGLYLAKQGKEECLICVAGLKQYSLPFPSVWCLAEEIETIYSTSSRLRNEAQLSETSNHHSNPTLSLETNSNSKSMGPPVQMTMERTGLDDISWPSQIPDHTHVQNHQQIDHGHGPGSGSMPLPSGMPSPINPSGAAKDFWPDGTPVPSRDVAWTLFDWLHQM